MEEGYRISAYVFGSFSAFTIINKLSRYTVPKSVSSSGPRSVWKWNNIFTSLIHSALTGTWAPIALFLYPEVSADLIFGYARSLHVLISISIGYFIYDFLDMFLYQRRSKSTYELLLHHSAVITCFFIVVIRKEFIGYAALALVVEINSVFLHLRQLMIIFGVCKTSYRYKAVAQGNVVTFILFRMILIGWMTYWILYNKSKISSICFIAGSSTLVIIVTLNACLFYRIVLADFMFSNPVKDKMDSDNVNKLVSSFLSKDDYKKKDN